MPRSGSALLVTRVVRQLVAAPPGSREARTLPLASTATHSLLLGHDTAVSELSLILRVLHAPLPPVGLVEVRTFPTLSTTAHSAFFAHKMAFGARLLSILATAQAVEPPFGSSEPSVGRVELTTLPSKSTAAQSLTVGQEIPVSPCPPLPKGSIVEIDSADTEPHANADTITVSNATRTERRPVTDERCERDGSTVSLTAQ